MFLKNLHLTNFRNYARLDLSFDQRPTILVGNNAAGKSNLLEAIYVLSTTKSLRVETELEMIKKEEEFAKVEGFLEDGETELLVIINEPTRDVLFRKKVLVNGISRRVTDFIGNLPAVIFYPSDINMVTGPPSLRRWHLDLALAQVDTGYKKALTSYEQLLTARNRVLKRIREGQSRVDELDYWTKELVEKGKVVSCVRERFFEFVNNLEKPLGEFSFEYKPSPVTVEKLLETNGREVMAAATLIGPHRDDFDIVIYDNVIPASSVIPANPDLIGAKAGIHVNNLSVGPKQSSASINKIAASVVLQLKNSLLAMTRKGGRDLAKFGSRGEQRTATLFFKLAQLEYMAKILGKRPILLLDDVFSELDASHRAHVTDVVSKQQTIIATVELENIPKGFLDSARILRVEDGKITEEI